MDRRRGGRPLYGGLALVALALLAASMLLPLRAQEGAAPPAPPPEAMDLPPGPGLAGRAEKRGDTKLDTALAELADGQGGPRLQGAADSALVEVVVADLAAAREAVAGAGGEVTIVSEDGSRLQAWVPVGALHALAASPAIQQVRTPEGATLPQGEPAAGLLTTEGARLAGADVWQAAGIAGDGVRIGVIDGGFAGFGALLGLELPPAGRVAYRDFVDPRVELPPTAHGTACAEIIHDMAPGASLYLARVNTPLELEQAALWMRAEGVDIISTSLGYFNLGPGDGTGFLADVVERARADGVLWVTSAGNQREAHWGGDARDRDGDGWLGIGGVREVNWMTRPIPGGTSLRIFARWSDWERVDQDLELYLLRWNGLFWEPVAVSADFQSGLPGQRPVETLFVTTEGPPAFYGVAMKRFAGDRAVDVEIFTADAPPFVAPTPERSLAILADSPGALTVAALDSRRPFAQEPYSSEGPTNGPGGAAAGGRLKPDLAAFANVSTLSFGVRGFNGTSAAAPHVAGAAALVAAAFPEAGPDSLRAFLQGRAIDRWLRGPDTVFGAGQLYLGAPPAGGADYDLDGDGRSDLIWSRPASGEVYAGYGAAAGVREVAPFAPAGAPGEVAVGAGDFDGDGRADLLWYEPGGRLLTLRLTGSAAAPAWALQPFWQVAGVGDLSGDGVDDILFRHTALGLNAVWLMRGGEVALSLGVDWRSPGWRVVALGDFDGDGRDDILWQSAVSGRYQRWLMDGAAVRSAEALAYQPGGPGWRVVGAADFDGDGDDDLLYRNSSASGRNGWVRAVFMAGGQPAARADLTRVSQEAFQIAALGDYNGDGRADMLWRDRAGGGAYIYYVDGGAVVGGADAGGADLSWGLVGAGTYDGVRLLPLAGEAAPAATGGSEGAQRAPGQPGEPSPAPADPDPGPPPADDDVPDTAPPDPEPQRPIDDLTLPAVADVDEASRQTMARITTTDRFTAFLPAVAR